jgi:ABC transporter substrate binding protein
VGAFRPVGQFKPLKLQSVGTPPGPTTQSSDDELREKAKELVGLAPDVVMAGGPPSVMALLKASRPVPIVFAAVTDPVGLGIVQDLARPGGNATGFLTAEFRSSLRNGTVHVSPMRLNFLNLVEPINSVWLPPRLSTKKSVFQ